ncbi:MAG: DUF1289 domain-containing protein [Alphaproteobacteria bacterium]|jgi:predicted Fe-S protein YdhL (DUF1289 family)
MKKKIGAAMVIPTEPAQNKQRLVSPCAGVCILHTDTKLCLGCYRTINEISHWQDMSADDQHRVMSELASRRAADRR